MFAKKAKLKPVPEREKILNPKEKFPVRQNIHGEEKKI
jgi:hypothetical protein